MPGGRMPKGRGTSYEYRVRNWFRDKGWQSERNNLSGASEQVAEHISKHDVRAYSNGGIFLQLECKKTASPDKHTLQREWFGKLDFNNDELLVFAFGNSPHYIIVPEILYASLDPSFVTGTSRYTAEGYAQFAFQRSWLDDEDPVCFLWQDYSTIYVATLLEKYIDLLEKRGPLEKIDPAEVIKAATVANLKGLVEWYKIHKHRLTNREKFLYYEKLCRLEEGDSGQLSRQAVVESQWWRDTSSDVVMKCPHCTNLITHAQLQENKEKGDKVQ